MKTWCVVFLLAGTACAEDWRSTAAAADDAFRARDWAKSKELLSQLNDVLNGHPSTIYGLARAEGQLGNHEAGLKLLRQFVSMGVTREMEKDPNLEPLRSRPEFGAIVAEMRERQQPVGKSAKVAQFHDPDLLTEDIAWDEKRGKFLVTSIHRAKVLLVGMDGRSEDFVSGVLPRGWGFLAVSPDARTNTLWVTAAAMEGAAEFAKDLAGKTALYAFDLKTGALKRKYDALEAGVWGELLLLKDGSVLLSNSRGSIDILEPGAGKVAPLIPKGELASAQSIAAWGDRLYLADYTRGILTVDRKTRQTATVKHPPDVCVQSIDGLYIDKRSLIAIQNGSGLSRIVRMNLNDAGDHITGMEVLESKTATMGSPTHGVFVKGRFYYLANTGWERVDGAAMKPGEPAQIRLCQTCESARH